MTMREIEATQIDTGMLYADDPVVGVDYEDPEVGDILVVRTRAWNGFEREHRIHRDDILMLDSEGRLC